MTVPAQVRLFLLLGRLGLGAAFARGGGRCSAFLLGCLGLGADVGAGLVLGVGAGDESERSSDEGEGGCERLLQGVSPVCDEDRARWGCWRHPQVTVAS